MLPPASSGSSTLKPASYARSHPSAIMIKCRVQHSVNGKPSTKSLDHLPPEILEQICRQLDGKSMGNLALSCKRLYKVFERRQSSKSSGSSKTVTKALVQELDCSTRTLFFPTAGLWVVGFGMKPSSVIIMAAFCQSLSKMG